MNKKQAKFFAHAATIALIDSYLSSDFDFNQKDELVISANNRQKIEKELKTIIENLSRKIGFEEISFAGTEDILNSIEELSI